jgi:LmbE family N-acetylglucosaminyl deacetylase
MYIHRISIFFLLLSIRVSGQYFSNKPSSEILHEIEKLQNTARVLYIAAHPDDENTRMITWLANSRKVTVAYLSLTRGEGGQNLIGSEMGDALGVIRTHELLKARKIDGGLQFFTRARDFGYSKSMEESLQLWNEDSVLKDVVQIIRMFKPDVMINRFPPDARAGHGHHSASAHLALRAFDLANDPGYDSGSVAKYGIWQPTRLYWNTSVWWIKDLDTAQVGKGKLLKINVGDFYPYLGAESGELSAYSRSQHKSQGFGIPASRGEITEYLQLESGPSSYRDLFENLDTGYGRWGCPALNRQAKAIATTFNHERPNLSIYKLNEFKKAIRQCVPEPFLTDLSKKIDELIWLCSGIYAEGVVQSPVYTPGDTADLQLTFLNRFGEMIYLRQIKTGDTTWVLNRLVLPGQKLTFSMKKRFHEGISQPFWLKNKGEYLYLSDENFTGKSLDPPLAVDLQVEVEGAEIWRKIPIVFKYNDRVKGEKIQNVKIFPKITGSIHQRTIYKVFDDEFDLSLHLNQFSALDSLWIKAVKSDKIQLQQDSLFLDQNIGIKTYRIPLKGKITGSEAEEISFQYCQNSADTGNPLLTHQWIEYDHIDKDVFFSDLSVKIIPLLNDKIKPIRIGYIQGSGDEIFQILKNSGFKVSEISPENTSMISFKNFDVIIGGIRLYNTQKNSEELHELLMQYVKEGGTYILQYQTSGSDLKIQNPGPYPFTIGRGRVTDEKAQSKILIPDHKILNTPYRITEEDLTNWHQEIGLYFAENFDSRYQAPLAWADPGENPQSGGLIITEYGKGKFVYTGLSFFRQLPSGHPGAFKLFVNLLYLNQ